MNQTQNAPEQVVPAQTSIGVVTGGSKVVLIVLGLIGVAVVAGISGIIGYKISEEQKEEPTSVSTQDEELDEPKTDITSTTTKTIENTESDSTAKTDPYDGWQTYENSDYAFSFKYPSEWETPLVEEYDNYEWNAMRITAGEANKHQFILQINDAFDYDGETDSIGKYTDIHFGGVEDTVYSWSSYKSPDPWKYSGTVGTANQNESIFSFTIFSASDEYATLEGRYYSMLDDEGLDIFKLIIKSFQADNIEASQGE